MPLCTIPCTRVKLVVDMALVPSLFPLGAVNAMQDVVVLANCIYNMKDSSPTSITAAFQEYYRQRYPLLDAQIKHSKVMCSVLGGKVTEQRAQLHHSSTISRNPC